MLARTHSLTHSLNVVGALPPGCSGPGTQRIPFSSVLGERSHKLVTDKQSWSQGSQEAGKGRVGGGGGLCNGVLRKDLRSGHNPRGAEGEAGEAVLTLT